MAISWLHLSGETANSIGRATTRPRAYSAPSAKTLSSTTTLRSPTSTGCARITSSGPSGVGRRKSMFRDAVTKRGVVRGQVPRD